MRNISTYLPHSIHLTHPRAPPQAPHVLDLKLTAPQSAIKSIRAIAPLLDRILVQRIKPEAKTAGGLFLPETAVKELNEAKVLAVGPGAFDREGKRVAPSVQPGDKVLIPQVRRDSSGEKLWRNIS
jgi:chaperonin GroES